MTENYNVQINDGHQFLKDVYDNNTVFVYAKK